MALRLHLDETVPRKICTGLRARGLDVTSTQETGLRGAADEEHVAYALRERRVIYTNDADFLRIDNRGDHHYRILFCDAGRLSIGTVIRRIVEISGRHAEDGLIDTALYLSKRADT